MSARWQWALLAAALTLLAVGLVLGFTSVSICGRVLLRDPEPYDWYSCAGPIAARRTITWVFLALGLLAGLGTVVLRVVDRHRDGGAAAAMSAGMQSTNPPDEPDWYVAPDGRFYHRTEIGRLPRTPRRPRE